MTDTFAKQLEALLLDIDDGGFAATAREPVEDLHQVLDLPDLVPDVPEILMHVAYSSTSGDRAAYPVGVHARRGARVRDAEGVNKMQVYEAALERDLEFFEPWAIRLRKDPYDIPRAFRHHVPKDGGGTRPIDDPSELGRLVGLYVRDLIRSRIEKALHRGQFGGRLDRYVVHHCPREGATQVDHVAWHAKELIRQRYDHVLLADLADAFGRVTMGLVVQELKGLGLTRRAAEWVWRLVRIHSQDRRSKKDIDGVAYTVGIMQGHPLSSLIMHLVLHRVLDELEAHLGARVLTYVDDIYVFARSQQDAELAHQKLVNWANKNGMKNVRPLGMADKASKVIPVGEAKLPVLKTYWVTATSVEMSIKRKARASEVLLDEGNFEPIYRETKKAAGAYAMSKRTLRYFRPRDFEHHDEEVPPRSIEGVGEELLHQEEGHPGHRPTGDAPRGVGLRMDRDHRSSNQGDSDPRQGDHHPRLVNDQGELYGPLAEHEVTAVPSEGCPDPSDGQGTGPSAYELRVVPIDRDPRSRGGVPGQAAASGEEEVEQGEVPRPVSSEPVVVEEECGSPFSTTHTLRVTDAVVVEAIRSRRWTSVAGFRPGGKNIGLVDLAGLQGVVGAAGPEVYLEVVNGLLRVVRHRDLVRVRWDAREPWTADLRLLGGPEDEVYIREQVNVGDDGCRVARLRHRRRERQPRHSSGPPAGVDLVVKGTMRIDAARRRWRVDLSEEAGLTSRVVTVSNPDAAMGEVEAVAKVIGQAGVANVVALPAGSILARLLLGTAVPRHSGLAVAVRRLTTGWTWSLEPGTRWAAGRRRPRAIQ